MPVYGDLLRRATCSVQQPYHSPLASGVGWLTSGAFRPASRTDSRDMDNDVSSSHDALLSWPAQIANALTISGSAACLRLSVCLVSVYGKFASSRCCAKPKSRRRKPDGTNLDETATVKASKSVSREALVDVTSCTAKVAASHAPLRSRATPGQDGLFAASCSRLRCYGINGPGVQEGLWGSLLCRI